jgi:alkylated DNA repair dioxygenase AlkB
MTLHKTNDPFDVTNCGAAGWVSRLRGYRYHPRDPLSGAPWPPMPTVFTERATEAADWAGYDGFAPDACLINRYEPCGEAHEVKGYDALIGCMRPIPPSS